MAKINKKFDAYCDTVKELYGSMDDVLEFIRKASKDATELTEDNYKYPSTTTKTSKKK